MSEEFKQKSSAIQAEIERQVIERTRILEARNRRLKEKYTALKALDEKRENDKHEIEKKVVANVEQLINPYLKKLAATKLNSQQEVLLGILTTNLNEIVLPFAQRLSTRLNNLTPNEMQVANQIRQGRTSAEIAQLLNLSKQTVETYRRNLRSKFKLTHRKTNLRTYLLSVK